jgi:hypothetical protein
VNRQTSQAPNGLGSTDRWRDWTNGLPAEVPAKSGWISSAKVELAQPAPTARFQLHGDSGLTLAEPRAPAAERKTLQWPGSTVFIWGTNRAPVYPNKGAPPASHLAPGVYETKPYTCIVVVPGATSDDKMAHSGGGTPAMPAIKPDLQFIPREKK